MLQKKCNKSILKVNLVIFVYILHIIIQIFNIIDITLK